MPNDALRTRPEKGKLEVATLFAKCSPSRTRANITTKTSSLLPGGRTRRSEREGRKVLALAHEGEDNNKKASRLLPWVAKTKKREGRRCIENKAGTGRKVCKWQ